MAAVGSVDHSTNDVAELTGARGTMRGDYPRVAGGHRHVPRDRGRPWRPIDPRQITGSHILDPDRIGGFDLGTESSCRVIPD
jgi:hypothetical protein